MARSTAREYAEGARDRAVLGVLAYTGVRIGAVASLRLSDYRDLGEQRVLRFTKKKWEGT